MDKSIRKIRLSDSSSISFEPGHREIITALAVSLDGTRALTCGRDKQVIAWDAVSGSVLSNFRAHNEQISAIALNCTGELAASYDQKALIKLWNTGKRNSIEDFLCI